MRLFRIAEGGLAIDEDADRCEAILLEAAGGMQGAKPMAQRTGKRQED